MCKRRGKQIFLILLAVSLIITGTFLTNTSYVQANEKPIVKVGFFPMTEFHQRDTTQEFARSVLTKNAKTALVDADMGEMLVRKSEFSSLLLKNDSMQEQTASISEKPSIVDFLRDYKFQFALVLGVFLAILFFFVMMELERKRRYELIQNSEQRLRRISENINGGVLILETDETMHIDYINVGFMELTGYTKEEYEADEGLHNFQGIRKDYVAMREAGEERLVLEYNLVKKDGTILPILIRGSLGYNEEGKEILYCAMLDISEERAMIQRLREEEERSRLLIEYSDSIFFDWSRVKSVIRSSKKFMEVLGWDISRKSGMPKEILEGKIHVDDLAELDRIFTGRGIQKGDVRFCRSNGEYTWYRLTISTILNKDGRADYIIGKLEDIDADVRKRENLEKASNRDPLTGLYNKQAFKRIVKRYMEGGSMKPAALYFIDLDNFKSINDTYGHTAGDCALQQVAEALRDAFRKKDVVGRFGGDEFYAFVPEINWEETEKKAEEIQLLLGRKYNGETGGIIVRASVGAALYPTHGTDFEELLKKADSAVYISKRKGKNRFTIYEETLAE